MLEKVKASMAKAASNKYPEGKSVEEYDTNGIHYTRTVFKRGSKTIIYFKAEHSWGATFYFKQHGKDEDMYQSIGSYIYEQETNKEA